MKTDKDLLVKGLKFMGIALVLMFSGPTLLYVVIGNQESSTYLPLFVIGILICIAAILVSFKGINTIMNSIFNRKN